MRSYMILVRIDATQGIRGLFRMGFVQAEREKGRRGGNRVRGGESDSVSTFPPRSGWGGLLAKSRPPYLHHNICPFPNHCQEASPAPGMLLLLCFLLHYQFCLCTSQVILIWLVKSRHCVYIEGKQVFCCLSFAKTSPPRPQWTSPQRKNHCLLSKHHSSSWKTDQEPHVSVWSSRKGLLLTFPHNLFMMSIMED